MGRMFRVTFVAKGSDVKVQTELSKFLQENSTEHVLIEELVGIVLEKRAS